MKHIPKYLNNIILLNFCAVLFFGCQSNKQTVSLTYTKTNDRISINVVNNTSNSIYVPKHFFCNRFGDTLFLEGGFKSEDGVKMAVYDFKPVKMEAIKAFKSISKLASCELSNKEVLVVRVYTMSFKDYLVKTSKQSSQRAFAMYEKAYSYIIMTD